eukprot:350239_1
MSDERRNFIGTTNARERRIVQLRRQRAQFIEESLKEENICCGCCNFRCWAIVLLIFKILGNIGCIIFGGWAIHGWQLGAGFGAAILIVSIISLCIHILALYGAVHGLSSYIFLGFVYEIIKLCFDFIYGICLGSMVSPRYFVTAICWVVWDCFVIWILWRVYKTALDVERDQ